MLILKKLWYYGIRKRPVPGWDLDWTGTCGQCSGLPIYPNGPRSGSAYFISKRGGKIGHCTNCGCERPTTWHSQTDVDMWRLRSADTFRDAPTGYRWHKLSLLQREKRMMKWRRGGWIVRTCRALVRWLKKMEVIQ